jgi:uncharacterized protein YqjF (DUF2071 family)
MKLHREGNAIRYSCRRLWPGLRGAGLEIEATIGDPLPSPNGGNPAGRAASDTLEHFLAERYFLYTQGADGRLWRAQVHHVPYPLRAAHVTAITQNLTAAAGIPVPEDFDHVLFSDGVSVEVFGLREVA